MIAARYNEEEHLSIQTVRGYLRTLEEWGYVESRKGTGRGQPLLWSNTRLEDCGEHGHVQFESEIQKVAT